MMIFRSIAFNVVMFGSGLPLSIWAFILIHTAPSKILGVGRFWAGINIAALRIICGIRIEVSGAEHLAGAKLIAAQHQSALDIMVWLRLVPGTAYVLKRELTKIPMFGTALVPSGMIAVNRGGGSASLQKMVEDCQVAIAAGRQIVIFPEGTRVSSNERVTLRSGIAALAKALNTEVIPAATDSGRYWGRRAFWKTRGTVKVKVYPPLSPTLSREDMLAQLARYFYEQGVG